MANSHRSDHDWSLAEAKNGLSELVRRARNSPQTICVRGERTAVVLSADDYDALTAPEGPKGLKDLLRAMNLEGVELERDPRPPRDVDL